MDPITIISTVVVAMIGAITAMWTIFKNWIGRLNKRSDDCEEDRTRIHTKLDEHGKALAIYAACPASDCPAAAGLRRAVESQAFNLKKNP